jgi:hypothetical protein
MPTTIAQRYFDELESWNESVKFYILEINHFASKLFEVIRRNSVKGIAEKVNVFQVSLTTLSEELESFSEKIQEQESEIKIDEKLIDDMNISLEADKQQNELRKQMKALDKKFIEEKYACKTFISNSKKD